MFVCGFTSHLGNFHSNVDVTFNSEGLQILTYTQHSWPSTSEDSLACYTYCETGQPVILVISEDPWHSHLLSSAWQCSCFNDLGLSRPGIEPWSPACDMRHGEFKLLKSRSKIDDIKKGTRYDSRSILLQYFSRCQILGYFTWSGSREENKYMTKNLSK